MEGENPHILMHTRMFLTQLGSTLSRWSGAELFLARTQLTKPQSIHQPHHPTNPLAVPLACIHWTHFHPPFAGCLSTAIWTRMMSHLSSRIFCLTFPHLITFHALDRHISAEHVPCTPEFKAEHKNSAFLTLLTLPNGFIPELYRKITTEKVTRWGVQGEAYKRNQLGDWRTWLKTDLWSKRTSVFHTERKLWQKQSIEKTHKTLHSWTDFLTSHSEMFLNLHLNLILHEVTTKYQEEIITAESHTYIALIIYKHSSK